MRHRDGDCKLQARNAKGIVETIYHLTEIEGDVLVGDKKAIKVCKGVFRLIPVANPSESKESACMPTVYEIMRYAEDRKCPEEIVAKINSCAGVFIGRTATPSELVAMGA